MSEDLHGVVQLLLARMKSHPEEFMGGDIGSDAILSVDDGESDRWWRAISVVENYGSDEEKAAVRSAMREIKLERAHQWALDELCNGEERRRKRREEDEYEAKMAQAMRAGTAQHNMNAVYNNYNQYQNAAMGGVANGYYDAATDSYYANGQWVPASSYLGKGTYPSITNNGLVATLKKGLGIK